MKSEDFQSIVCLRVGGVVGFAGAISEDRKRVLVVLCLEGYVRCEVQRRCGSLDEWVRSDSARVGIENDSTSAPLLR